MSLALSADLVAGGGANSDSNNSNSVNSGRSRAQYENKLILAPMVKIGTLPFRLLSLRYGADLVYSEELIDWRILRSKRVFNEMLGTIEYIDETDGSLVFSTNEEERERVILQMGTSDPDRALQVLKKVEGDVSGIDVNMGCPKEFSIKGGMGAALLKKPEKVKAILTTLVAHAKIPVTCKIRVLASLEETIKLAKMIESTGVSALAIHGRNVNERPQHANRNGFIKAVAEELSIPVIANGGSKEISSHADITKFKESTGASSVMLARAAEYNPSLFRKEGGKLDIDEVITEFLKLAVLSDNPFSNTKYTVQNMLRELQETPRGKDFLASQTIGELCAIWDLKKFYDKKTQEFSDFKKRKAAASVDGLLQNGESDPKKLKMDPTALLDSKSSFPLTIVPDCTFIRGHYTHDTLPKTLLSRWAGGEGFKGLPKYKTEFLDKKFISEVELGGRRWRTDVWEKNKKQAEQGAALAACRALQIIQKKEPLSE